MEDGEICKMIRESLEELKNEENGSFSCWAVQREIPEKLYEKLIGEDKLNTRYRLYKEIDIERSWKKVENTIRYRRACCLRDREGKKDSNRSLRCKLSLSALLFSLLKFYPRRKKLSGIGEEKPGDFVRKQKPRALSLD